MQPTTPTTPPPASPGPSPAALWAKAKAAQNPIDATIESVDPILDAGFRAMDNPSSLGARPQTPVEHDLAQIQSARTMESQLSKADDFATNMSELEGMVAAFPKEAKDLGTDPEALWQKAKSGLATIGEPVMGALDYAGHFLDAPAQAIFGGLIAAHQGKDPIRGAADAFAGRTPGRIYGGDVLEEFGVPSGPSLRDAAKAIGDYANTHLGTSVDLPAITPDITARDAAGFVGEVLNPLDPLNHLSLGAAKGALRMASGKALNAAGEEAFRTIESAHFLRNLTERAAESAAGENVLSGKTARHILDDFGVTEALQRARPGIDDLTAKAPDAANILRHKATVAFAHERVNEVLRRALEEGHGGVLQEMTTASRIAGDKIDDLLAASDAASQRLGALQKAIRGKIDPQLAEALGTESSALRPAIDAEIEKASKQLLKWEDVGGLRLGPVTIIPGKPVRAGLARAGAAAQKIPGIPALTDAAARVAEMGARVFEPLWGTPPAFRRYVKEELFGRTVAMHFNVNMEMKRLFKGVSLKEAEALTKAIDSGTVETLPGKLQEVAAKMKVFTDALFDQQVAAGHLKPDDRVENYIYHYYKNERKAAEVLAQRRGALNIKEFRDPSTWQREIPTLAEAEALGLSPEYDARKLLTMRLVNGNHQLIQHKFLEGAAHRFGLPEALRAATDETNARTAAERLSTAINETLRDGGAAMKRPLTMEELVRGGHVDLADATNVQPVAYQMVRDGGTKTTVETLRSMPDPYKTEFLRWRFIKARSGGAREIANVERKYSEFLHLAPKGDAGERIANALGLPRPHAGDGKYVNAVIPHVGPVTLPRRIAEKLSELGKRETIWSEQGKPLQDLLRFYDRAIMNRFRLWNTAPNPAFHFRNSWNNAVQSGMDIGLAVLDPVSRADAIAMTRGMGRHIIKLKTGPVSAQELEREFIGQGLYTSFLQRAQVTAPNAAKAAADEVVREMKPLHALSPFYIGGKVGETIENDARRLHYLALRKDGIPAAQAASRVQKFLFDYQNDYTPTEREVLRRIIPFYGWASKNLSLQTNQLVTRPKTALNWWRLGQTMQRDRSDPMRPMVERSLMPSYVDATFGIRIGERDGGRVTRWVSGFDLPQADINNLWAGSLNRTVERWVSQTGPVGDIVRALYAQAAGPEKAWRTSAQDDARTYAIFGSLVEKAPPLASWLEVHQAIDRRTGQAYWVANKTKVQAMLGMLMMTPGIGGAYERPLRDVSRFIDPNKDSGWSALAHWLTGGSFTDYTPGEEAASRAAQTMGDAAKVAGEKQRDLETRILGAGIGGAP